MTWIIPLVISLLALVWFWWMRKQLTKQELEDKFIQTMLIEIIAGTIFAAWLIWAAILFA